MKALVIHNSLNSIGGGERVCLHIVKALMEAGFDVSLATVERTNWGKVLDVMGIDLPKIPREYTITRELRIFGIYQRSLTTLHVARFRKRFNLIINTHGDVMLLPTDITYLHFPVFALLAEEPWRYYTKYLSSVFWRMYFEPYRIIQKRFAKWCFSKSLLLTNSKFSRDVIRKYIGKDAVVIYPPVEISDYVKISRNTEREDAVITISRFTPEKNLDLIPFIAQKLKNVKFYLIGSIRGSKSREYMTKIARLKRQLNIDNLEIIANAPHIVKLQLLSKSKVLLHLMPYEHFGIVVVEGMASGCIPVVHKSGGQ